MQLKKAVRLGGFFFGCQSLLTFATGVRKGEDFFFALLSLFLYFIKYIHGHTVQEIGFLP
jgi:hypothetical protein